MKRANGSIVVSTQHAVLRFSHRETIRTARSVLRLESRTFDEISVVFVNDAYMKKINQRFLKHRETTDVISFSLGNERNVDGEIFVNLDRARVQAKQYGVSFTAEARRLLIHGLLHLVGHNDRMKNEKKNMTAREDFYLKRLGERKS